MTGRIFTSTHQTYDLPPLLSWSVVHTGTVPCDSYTVTCLYSKEMAPILPLAAGFIGFEDGQLVARGIVDDFSVDLDGGGTTVTITGRGAAARLLDNESRPVTYQDATLEEIVMDSKTGREVLGFLKKLNREGDTVVLITHDNSIAVKADRIIRLQDGKVIYDGDAHDPRAVVQPDAADEEVETV